MRMIHTLPILTWHKIVNILSEIIDIFLQLTSVKLQKYLIAKKKHLKNVQINIIKVCELNLKLVTNN